MNLETQAALEREVLDLFLKGDHFVLCALRAQLAQVQGIKREMTGVGFWLDFELPASTLGVHEQFPVNADFEFGDVEASLLPDDQIIGFRLFIREGKLRSVEGYVCDDLMIPTIKRFEVGYTGEGRNMAELERTWSREA
ncbi:MAG: hypothetical protein HZB26_16800 [Candidatus Hydrogenedentes bacterium]|nr:hypothetical protein [Candidatus Hydrogenedentota bacterium]